VVGGDRGHDLTLAIWGVEWMGGFAGFDGLAGLAELGGSVGLD